MTDRDPIWDALKAHTKEQFNARRAAALEKAASDDDGGWVKHTPYHWSRYVDGERLDYWPSRRKFSFKGKIRHGDVMQIVKESK